MSSRPDQPRRISSANLQPERQQKCRFREGGGELTRFGYLDTSSKPFGVVSMPSKSEPIPTLEGAAVSNQT